MNATLLVISGFCVGTLVGYLLFRFVLFRDQQQANDLAQKILEEHTKSQRDQMDAVIANIKSTFGDLSLEALAKSSDQFLKLASERFQQEREVSGKDLTGKKELIDHQLKKMDDELKSVSNLIKGFEKDRSEKFGAIDRQLKATNEATSNLIEVSQRLHETLASTKNRGQWGERMAEDVLRLAGFIENINYRKNKALSDGRRPDFTFFLPNDLIVNMDVKFPWDNYLRFMEAENVSDKTKYSKAFLADVKNRIKEVTSRDYIDPGKNTVDYVLLFIPNEQVFTFIHETDPKLLDDSLKQRVVFCSPITLFAVLAVIRQSVENFALHQKSNEMLELFGTFKKQWGQFITKMDSLGKRISDTQKEYESLTTTRKRQLEKPLQKIESMRLEKGLEAPDETKSV